MQGRPKGVATAGAGDSTANLMWRLQNGEAPPGLRARAVVLHIGNSDLTYASFQVWKKAPLKLFLSSKNVFFAPHRAALLHRSAEGLHRKLCPGDSRHAAECTTQHAATLPSACSRLRGAGKACMCRKHRPGLGVADVCMRAPTRATSTSTAQPTRQQCARRGWPSS